MISYHDGFCHNISEPLPFHRARHGDNAYQIIKEKVHNPQEVSQKPLGDRAFSPEFLRIFRD